MSAVHDGRCSPWVMCSCSVVRGNQIRDRQKCSGLPSNVYTQSSAALINASLSDEMKMLLKLF